MEEQHYKYLVISYKSSGTNYWGRGGQEDFSSKFHQFKLYDEDEVINHIFSLELDECIENNFRKMNFFWYDHYVYTTEDFGPPCDEYGWYRAGPELSESWQEKIIDKVNKDLVNREAEKEAARLAKEREVVIMKEQEEQREYERLSKKYGGFKNL